MDKPSQFIAKAEIFYQYFRRDANTEARRLFREAIELNPALSQPYAELAYAELTAWLYNWDPSIQDLGQTLTLAETAVQNGIDDYYNHWILADVHLYKKDFGLASDTYNKALDMAKSQCIPEEERAMRVDWADMLSLTGQATLAIEEVTKAIDASAVPERWFYWVLGWAYYAAGKYELSLEAMNKLGNPRNAMRKNMIANLVALNRLDDADTQAKRFLEEEKDQGISFNNPGFPVWPAMEKIEDRVPFQDDKQLALWKQHLETAFGNLVAP